ncbi:MAG: hypothetical protein AB7D07_10425 [Desulfovibrionaceae bacterium]|jgi:hypothetical protein
MIWAWALMAAAVLGQLPLLAWAWAFLRKGLCVPLWMRATLLAFGILGCAAGLALSDPLPPIAQGAAIAAVWRWTRPLA